MLLHNFNLNISHCRNLIMKLGKKTPWKTKNNQTSFSCGNMFTSLTEDLKLAIQKLRKTNGNSRLLCDPCKHNQRCQLKTVIVENKAVCAEQSLLFRIAHLCVYLRLSSTESSAFPSTQCYIAAYFLDMNTLFFMNLNNEIAYTLNKFLEKSMVD